MNNLLEPDVDERKESDLTDHTRTAGQQLHYTGNKAELLGNAHQDVSRTPDVRGRARQIASSVLLLGIIVLSGAIGYLFGEIQRSPVQQDALSASLSAPVQQTETTNETSVSTAEAHAFVKQQQITDQLGVMRAELLRLHSLYVHLAEMAELDDGEFDLESPLLDWKEQSTVHNIGVLNRRVAHMSEVSDTLESIFQIRRQAFDQKISGLPVLDGRRSSGFGYRVDPITGERVEHLGLDFSGPVGEPILALADGVVTFSGKNSGYGNLVELEHVDGLRTRYAHNQANLVTRGDRVEKGQPIATLGSTGRSTGPHVHVEVRLDGEPIDPGFFIR